MIQTLLIRSAQKREIFAPVARASCERCIASYIAAPHFRCHTEASDNRCRDAARPSRGRGSFRGGGTPPRKIFFVLFLLQKKERSNLNSESCRRPAAARKNDENSKTPRLRKREYTGKVNERYAQREVSGIRNRTPVAAVRTAHAVLMRGALRREIFAHAARTSCERCIVSYIAAPHFRCRTEASDDRCRDAA